MEIVNLKQQMFNAANRAIGTHLCKVQKSEIPVLIAADIMYRASLELTLYTEFIQIEPEDINV